MLWNKILSSLFDIKSGVLQGSTKFYNLIMDKLLKLLHNNVLDFHVVGVFIEAVAYASDIILLFASRVKLQQMLQLCESFDVKCDLKFNVVKLCIGYVSSCVRAQVQFLLEGRVLPWVDRLKYVGITFVLGKVPFVLF